MFSPEDCLEQCPRKPLLRGWSTGARSWGSIVSRTFKSLGSTTSGMTFVTMTSEAVRQFSAGELKVLFITTSDYSLPTKEVIREAQAVLFDQPELEIWAGFEIAVV